MAFSRYPLQYSHPSLILVALFFILNLFPSICVVSSSCHYDFRVYVYPLPARFLVKAEEARRNQTYHICRKCIFEQFALEYIIYDFFTQFCGRVSDPEKADFFYLPIIRDIDYRMTMYSRGGREPSLIEKILLALVEINDTSSWLKNFEMTDKYWRRYRGSDHIIVMPAPVTNLRHQSNARGFFHYVRSFILFPYFINCTCMLPESPTMRSRLRMY